MDNYILPHPNQQFKDRRLTVDEILNTIDLDNNSQIMQSCDNSTFAHPLQTILQDFEKVYLDVFEIKSKLENARSLPSYQDKQKVIDAYQKRLDNCAKIVIFLVKNLNSLTIGNTNEKQ